MKSNKMLTYLLYALLGVLVLAAAYKGCQMQKEKQRQAQEDAEFQETLKKLYPGTDTTAGGSSYVSADSVGVSKSNAGSTRTPSSTSTATPPPTTTSPPKTTTKSNGSSTTAKGVGTGKWEVRAGTFSQMSNARDRLEQIIQLGYTNAEIRKTADGKAAVIVMRTNDKNKAVQTVDQLERRGIDAAVFAR